MNFADRQPSADWEVVPVPDLPKQCFWVWFRPAVLPDGLLFRIPEPLDGSPVEPLSLRRLLETIGIDAGAVDGWIVYEQSHRGMRGAAPELDHPIAPPPPKCNPNIYVRLVEQQSAAPPPKPTPAPQPVMQQPAVRQPPVQQPPVQQPPVQQPPVQQPVAQQLAVQQLAGGQGMQQPAGESAGVDAAAAHAIFDRIDVDWQAALLLERQTAQLRGQLTDMMSRLNGLNRDLTPEERMHSNRKDRSDWLIARRWLRDLAFRISKCLKEQDVGDSSLAGRRAWFADIYDRVISRRQHVPGLEQVQRDFESYRKLVQTKQIALNGAIAAARQDGERRAQEILTRISASVRTARGKRK